MNPAWLFYSKFNQGTAGGDNASVTQLIDESANASHGTLTNFALNGATSNWVASGGLLHYPEADLTGNNVAIASGATAPNVTDGTDFGTLPGGEMVEHTFTLTNSGSADLHLLGVSSEHVTVDGSSAFTVTAQPETPVAPAGTTTFTVKFAPTTGGTQTATIRVASDDCDENPYEFQVQGNGIVPDIAVEQPIGNDLNGGASVDFGAADVATATSLTFTIRNLGLADLTGVAITIDDANASDFVVTAEPATTLVPNDSTTFTVQFTPGAPGSRTATLHIASNDPDENPFDLVLNGSGNPYPTISIDSVAVSEGDGSATFTVMQSAVSALETSFSYSTADGTAQAPGDYTAATNLSGTIPAGMMTTTISIPITDDSIHENTEAFTVTLSDPQNATLDVATGTATITDDDAAPTFTVDSVSQAEGNDGATNFVFTVTKNGLSALSSTVDYATADGTATTADADYVASSGTLTFAPNETTQQITVAVNGDRKAEADETFTVVLSSGVNATSERLTVPAPEGVGTILNDDHAPAADDLTVTTDANVARTITLSATDADGEALDFSIMSGPAHGALGAVSAANCGGGACTATVTYTPANGYEGADSFTYKANDGSNDSNAATVSITVAHVAPIVSNTNDSGAGSLRQALFDSQDGDTIAFNIPTTDPGYAAGVWTITLTSGELPINRNVVVDGPGADVCLVRRDVNAPSFRIFHVLPNKTVTISGLTIANGRDEGAGGGGIYNNHSILTVTDCTVSGNTADFVGGGLLNDGSFHGTATLTVLNSLIAGNRAAHGGGMFDDAYDNGSATMSVGNSTISANIGTVTGGGIGAQSGGGLPAITIANSTLADNNGASIRALDGGTLDMGNTIVKTCSGSITGFDTITSHGYNLLSDSGGSFFTAAGDQINTDPMLGPLKNNGGRTFTHAPLINSPALDQGKRDTIAALSTNVDQRGLARPFDDPAVANAGTGDASDIGAVEIQASEVIHPTSAASRKTHGAAGAFEIDLPLVNFASSPVGIECRSGGTTGDYTVIVRFAGNVNFTSAQVTSCNTNGSVSSSTGSGTSQITINLTGVTDMQTLTLALFDVDDGISMTDVGLRLRLRLGDVTGNDVVNSTDVGGVKAEVSQAVSQANFRNDVTANGAITSSDVGLVKAHAGVNPPPAADGEEQ